MQVSHRTLEAFQTDRTEQQEREQQSNSEQQAKISAQILQAAQVVRAGSYAASNSDSVFYHTHWVNVSFDITTDTLTQARLYGSFDPRSRFVRFLTGAPHCVQLHLRSADNHTDTRSKTLEPLPYDYAALFSVSANAITVPRDTGLNGDTLQSDFPYEGDVVLPDSPKWRELDYLLGQIAASPR